MCCDSMKYSIIIILLILCIFITGCVTGSDMTPQDDKIVRVWTSDYIDDTDGGRVTKIRVPEDNVTCYVFDNYYGGGISCIENRSEL
jgi:hypothetical protein